MKTFLMSLLFIAFALILTTDLQAKPIYGIRGGLNFASFSKQGSAFARRTGITFGCDVEFPLGSSKTLSIRTEGMYVMKGAKSTNQMVTYKTDELVLAPLMVLRLSSGSASPFVQAGPELGINMGKSEVVRGQYPAPINWASTNFGLNFGAGVAIPSGRGEILLDARYNLGLSDMENIGGFGAKTNGFMLTAGYHFSAPKI